MGRSGRTRSMPGSASSAASTLSSESASRTCSASTASAAAWRRAARNSGWSSAMSRVCITAILAGIRALAGRRALVPKYDDPYARACYCRGMIKIPAHAATALSLALLLGACASGPQRSATEAPMFTSERSSDHRDGDDLLTAGLGLDGLQIGRAHV